MFHSIVAFELCFRSYRDCSDRLLKHGSMENLVGIGCDDSTDGRLCSAGKGACRFRFVGRKFFCELVWNRMPEIAGVMGCNLSGQRFP